MISTNSEQSKSPKKTNKDENVDKEHIAKELSNNSFFNLTTIVLKNVQLNAPYPVHLNYDHLINLFPDPKNGFLNGYVVKDLEGVFCTNEEVVAKQSGVFTEMAKQFAKGLFNSGTISMSLPIRVFEPRSMLERYTDWWAYAPFLLKKAGNCSNKLEAFKYVICFSLSAMFLSTGQLKPFNPLLGETFQGYFEEGTNIYLEHTSHIPCVSNYLVSDVDGFYKFYGYNDISVEGAMKMMFNNHCSMVSKGKNTVELKGTGQKISFQYPKVTLGGMIYGSRYVLWDGHMKFEDHENSLKAIIYFNRSNSSLKYKRCHDFYGQIFNHEFQTPKKGKEPSFFESKAPKLPSDKKHLLSEITGSWLENIMFDNKEYWNISEKAPCQIYPVKQAVPSDCRNREDLIWLKRSQICDSKSYEEYAQQWKVALEIQQRHDRALRDKSKKKK
jgi:hypothetical protein